jgi:hypothetical protein
MKWAKKSVDFLFSTPNSQRFHTLIVFSTPYFNIILYLCTRIKKLKAWLPRHQPSTLTIIDSNFVNFAMNRTDILLLCIYAPFALAALWVVACLLTGRTSMIPRFIARCFNKKQA